MAQVQIDDPRACSFDPAILHCAEDVDEADCLTPAQIQTVKKLYQGPVDDQGRRLYPGGEPLGSELAWDGYAVSRPGGQGLAEYAADNYLKYLANRSIRSQRG